MNNVDLSKQGKGEGKGLNFACFFKADYASTFRPLAWLCQPKPSASHEQKGKAKKKINCDTTISTYYAIMTVMSHLRWHSRKVDLQTS